MIKDIFTGSDEQSLEKEKEILGGELRLRNQPGWAKKQGQETA